MFELTNEQRKCFAIPPVLDTWKKTVVQRGPYDRYDTYAYLDGQRIMRIIQVCDNDEKVKYREYSVDQLVSEDGTQLLPKTAKGKPQKFSAPYLERRTPVGMSLAFSRGGLSIYNNSCEQVYYCSTYESLQMETFEDFRKWINDWCSNTGEKELAEINEFARKKKVHQKYREGDFFRYKINRYLYGYGRILLDFDEMRKNGEKFWEIFMGKPLCVAIYHIATENSDMTPEQLSEIKLLPSQMIMDNIFFYGECEIIGNMTITEREQDYPIHYGKSIDSCRPNCIHYQCGRVFVTLDNEKELYDNFRNGGIGWGLDVTLPILKECIAQNSNEPYWKKIAPWRTNHDLRNPKFKKELTEIKKQMKIK